MKLYFHMPESLLPFFKQELQAFHNAMKKDHFQLAWRHLERAHIIGQRYPFTHSFVHFKMLRFGFKIKNPKEILGQIPRLIVGGVKSFVGKVPVGNPGGANVPPLKPFPLEAEISEIFIKAGLNAEGNK